MQRKLPAHCRGGRGRGDRRDHGRRGKLTNVAESRIIHHRCGSLNRADRACMIGRRWRRVVANGILSFLCMGWKFGNSTSVCPSVVCPHRSPPATSCLPLLPTCSAAATIVVVGVHFDRLLLALFPLLLCRTRLPCLYLRSLVIFVARL